MATSTIHTGARPSADAEETLAFRVFRTVRQIGVGWTFAASYAVLASVFSMATLGRASTWLTPMMMRVFGRVSLGLQGVKLEIEGMEHLEPREMKVATFNHTSLLDAMIVPYLNVPGSVSAIKREVLYVPFVGVSLYLMGFLLVDRARSERGKRLLQEAAARMADERLTVFIAPEGTRSPDGDLQPFKKGAFHLALASGAPIVPVVIEGAYACQPRQHWTCKPGTIHIRVLPPIDTSELTLETMEDFIQEVHDLYATTLAEMKAARQ